MSWAWPQGCSGFKDGENNVSGLERWLTSFYIKPTNKQCRDEKGHGQRWVCEAIWCYFPLSLFKKGVMTSGAPLGFVEREFPGQRAQRFAALYSYVIWGAQQAAHPRHQSQSPALSSFCLLSVLRAYVRSLRSRSCPSRSCIRWLETKNQVHSRFKSRMYYAWNYLIICPWTASVESHDIHFDGTRKTCSRNKRHFNF